MTAGDVAIDGPAGTSDGAQEPHVGEVAPAFSLISGSGTTVSLADYLGQPAILAFYPADWSSVCGDQLALYNEVLPEFERLGAVLLGISVDSMWSHRAFVEARGFKFELLADFEPKGAVARQYGVYRAQDGTSERALFVIRPDGRIAWKFISPIEVNPGADGILDALEALERD